MDKNHQAPAITVSRLNIRYEHHWLFNDFGFSLPAGQWSCLLGPSGIGKSTLLRFIAGLQHENSIECSGNVVTSDSETLSGRLTYLTQHDSLLPWLTVIENVLLGFRLRSEQVNDRLRQQAIDLLTKVGLSQVMNLKPSQLSNGMKQRVVLVRAIIEDRMVVLMDEPFSALDTITRLRLQDLAASLLINRTVLLVTHDPLEALRLGHYIYIINGSPARISHVIRPEGLVPRDISDPVLLAEQAKLLQALANNELELGDLI